MAQAKTPFAWAGSKRLLAPEIIKLIPKHEKYVEVFGGALNVLFQKPRSNREAVNDINDELVNLHRTIQKHPKELREVLDGLLISRTYFNDIKNKKMLPENDIERAAFYFYLLVNSFGSKGGSFSNVEVRFNHYYKNFQWFSERLRGVVIENSSFSYIIPNYDEKDAFFYLDPPYVGTEKVYSNIDGFGLKEHEELARLLKQVKGKFMLSYNDCELVRELYKGYHMKELKIKYSINNKKEVREDSTELLIMNYTTRSGLKFG